MNSGEPVAEQEQQPLLRHGVVVEQAPAVQTDGLGKEVYRYSSFTLLSQITVLVHQLRRTEESSIAGLCCIPLTVHATKMDVLMALFTGCWPWHVQLQPVKSYTSARTSSPWPR